MPVEFKMQEYDKYIMRFWIDKNGILPPDVTFRTDKKGFFTSFGELLRTQPRAIKWFRDRLSDIDDVMPIFNRDIIFGIIDEQAQHGVDNSNRLLSLISLLKYVRSNRLELCD